MIAPTSPLVSLIVWVHDQLLWIYTMIDIWKTQNIASQLAISHLHYNVINVDVKYFWVETMQTSFAFVKWFPGDYANEMTKVTPHGPSVTLLEAATW